MQAEINGQHPLFIKYTRPWLNQVTGYTKGYLSRVATGKIPLSQPFIERVCYKLNQPEEELFLLDGAETGPCHSPYGCPASKIGQWLQERCRKEHLSTRQAAALTGLTHTTIADIINGGHPSPETIRKLSEAFGGNGNRRLALEDKLLVLAGYRSEHPKRKDVTEPKARILDKLDQLSEPQLKMMERFADFLTEMQGRF